jgi:hypothetical protein
VRHFAYFFLDIVGGIDINACRGVFVVCQEAPLSVNRLDGES